MRPDSGNNVHFGDVFDPERRLIMPAEEQIARANSATTRAGEQPKVPGNQYRSGTSGEVKNHRRPSNLSFLFEQSEPPAPRSTQRPPQHKKRG